MRFPLSDHCDGKQFFNPGIDIDKSYRDLRRWRRSRQPAPWPERLANTEFPPPPSAIAGDDIALTLIGQATLLVHLAGVNILTDPIFSARASPLRLLGPKRVRDPAVALDRLPRIDLVLLSHNHYDHLDLPSLRALRLQRRAVRSASLRKRSAFRNSARR